MTGFTITTDANRLDIPRIHRFLSNSYWATGIPLETVAKSIQNSLCFGVFHEVDAVREQVGFARVVTDSSTFAYLCDVYIEEAWRGQGLSKMLMESVLAHPALQGLRRFSLGTKDAHTLYSRYGFETIRQPENWMEIKVNGIYQR